MKKNKKIINIGITVLLIANFIYIVFGINTIESKEILANSKKELIEATNTIIITKELPKTTAYGVNILFDWSIEEGKTYLIAKNEKMQLITKLDDNWKIKEQKINYYHNFEVWIIIWHIIAVFTSILLFSILLVFRKK